MKSRNLLKNLRTPHINGAVKAVESSHNLVGFLGQHECRTGDVSRENRTSNHLGRFRNVDAFGGLAHFSKSDVGEVGVVAQRFVGCG
jgi:hypothetical protein